MARAALVKAAPALLQKPFTVSSKLSGGSFASEGWWVALVVSVYMWVCV